MQPSQAGMSTPMNDSSKAVLDYLHRLLRRSNEEQPSLAGLLAELAEVFEVTAVGLASLPEGRIVHRHPSMPVEGETTWPWQEDPNLLNRANGGNVHLERAGCPMLLAVFTGSDRSNWLLWLEDARRTAFTDSEAAALCLAGQILARGLANENRAKWADRLDLLARQERMETTANVTRRLAHDFGNILTGILGFTELALNQQIPTSAPLHSYLTETYRAAQNGAQFTHQLRLFSRRQSGSSRGCQLATLLAEQEARLFAAQPNGLNLRFITPAELPSVALDPEHLHQVLTALLDNARESLAGPGTISVSARTVELSEDDCMDLFGAARPGPHVELVIADTGVGLSPEVRQKLFAEPFFSTKPRRRGFGLAVTYGILTAHRGGLRLHSGEEGGVVARVLLPVAPAPSPMPTTEEVVRPTERLRGDRILVVDDEPEVLNVVSASLTRAGFRVEPVNSGEAALQAYFAHSADPFSLVITDVLMPGIGGVELVRRLMRRDPSVRVLFMSGHVSTDFTREDFADQAFEFLAKPFRPEQLVRVTRAAIERSSRPVRRRDQEAAALTSVGKK